ncbi:MAG: hypothetical protein QOG53_2461 [Frankiales bacterium]|nr:hypothetical protein [Frankiales bacterium]
MSLILRRLALALSLVVSIGAAVVASAPQAAGAAALPPGFAETQVATGLVGPTAMTFAPDGRLFITQQGGQLRVIKNGALLAAPFLTVSVDASGERGLLGVAFDPNFATNQYVYVYYTTSTAPIHNRVSRFTAAGDVAQPGSEVPILELDELTASIHNGGAIHFGPDGALYIAVGDNAKGAPAQMMSTRWGKMLRILPDGTIPTDNPFYDSASGANKSIWALGLRNPFTFAFKPGTSRMFINDVGQDTWEEINDGIVGANYGWPDSEGPTTNPAFLSPLYAYGHEGDPNGGCAITGGAFYNPQTVRFPSSYVGDYFFADYCKGWIHRYDPSDGSVVNFTSVGASPVDLEVGKGGSLWYLTRGGGVFKIDYTANPAPSIGTQPQSQTVSQGGTATFSVAANGVDPLTYQWQRDRVNIAGANSATYELTGATVADDDGARFRVVVSNAHGSATSNEALLSVTTDTPPTPTIDSPDPGTFYSGGDTIDYAGSATDAEDANLPASSFTWQIDFHHADHVHPFMQPTSGATGGSFQIPTVGHTDANVFYRILLTVQDSAGLSTTVYRDVQPRVAQLTLATSPSGLALKLDDQPRVTPLTVTGVVGVQRNLEAPSPQVVNGTKYEFVSWSDGGARAHTIGTPASDTTYTATFREVGDGLNARYYNNPDFTGTTLNRVDPKVNFDWGTSAPATGIGADTFSVRWVGRVRPPTSGTYRFYTQVNDGVRLWVNGTQLVNNWANHAAVTENSGTIALTANVRYSIRMEFYDNIGNATARLLWSGPSVAKAIVPTSALFSRFTASINFQPAGAPVPAGYFADTGATFGLRAATGERYGWKTNNAAQAVDRNDANSPDQRYDTLTQLQNPASPNAVWEIMLPNGTYSVHAVVGDPSFIDSNYQLNADGVTVVSGTPTATEHWFDGTANVTVTDGRLTLTNGPNAINNKVCFIEIS